MKKVLMLGSTVILLLAGDRLSAADVQIKVGKDSVDFLAGDKLVTTYHIGPQYAKPIFWPVLAPGDIKVTRDWPMIPLKQGETGSTDHIHQKSAWFCWGDVIPEGLEIKDKIKGIKGVDFWSEAKGHGRIVCTEVGKPVIDKANGHLVTKNEWRMADGTKIMDETRHVNFYDFGKARLIVLGIRLDATVCPITFGDTKEGAMGVRVNDLIRADKNGKGKIQNAEGKVNEKECWGQLSAWCDYSGPIEGKMVGIAVLCDPKNAQPSCWHTRGYGLHAANPFGRSKAAFPAMKGRTDLVRLAKGESIQFRYGILVHEGDAETGRVAEYFDRFVKLRDQEK